MGLVISYHLSLTATVDEAREVVLALRSLALNLPFAQVDEFVELQGENCILDMYDLDDPYVFLKLRGVKVVDRTKTTVFGRDASYLMAFDTLPGQGSETAAFGLATHSAISEVNDWIWTGFCKTQYASNPEYGGRENFLRCHLAIVTLLDEAQKFGIQCEVDDQGNYWETRSVPVLTAALSAENVFMATTMGAIKDAIDPAEATLEAPILEYPNFEHLEAGQEDSA